MWTGESFFSLANERVSFLCPRMAELFQAVQKKWRFSSFQNMHFSFKLLRENEHTHRMRVETTPAVTQWHTQKSIANCILCEELYKSLIALLTIVWRLQDSGSVFVSWLPLPFMMTEAGMLLTRPSFWVSTPFLKNVKFSNSFPSSLGLYFRFSPFKAHDTKA